MEERSLELDDDGKIKLKKGGALPDEESEEEDDLLIEVPDFDQFRAEDGRVGMSEEELAAKAAERETAAAAKKEESAKLLREADELFDSGDLPGAGEKYLDSAAANAADWRPWFGVVRVQTKDLTDFSEIYECEHAYERALRRMSKEDRAALAEKYLPSMEGEIARAEKEAAEFAEKDKAEREAVRPGLEKEAHDRTVLAIVFVALFAAFAVAGGVLASFISAVRGMGILIPAIVCIAAAVVLLFFAAWAVKKFISARLALAKNAREGSSSSGKKAAELSEYAELVRSVADDFKK